MKKTIHFLIIGMLALCWLSACSNLAEPSAEKAKEYFIEECISGVEVESLSDDKKNTNINFELVTRVVKGKKMIFTIGLKSDI